MGTTVFLSYARGDDGEPYDPARSFVTRIHGDLTARGFDVWFDRKSMQARRLTFHQEIRDAIAARERFLLVVGPRAVTSEYVRQEWQFAWFEADKVVTPILRLGNYPIPIEELKGLHCEDFRNDADYAEHLDQLVRMLREPPAGLGKLIAVPSLPAHFLPRSDGLTKIRDALRADLDRPVVIGGAAARVGMHGMGGIGKSVLAAALARDRKVREAFPDGIVWVGLGSSPDLRALLQRVHRDLGGDGATPTEHEGKQRLKELVAEKAVLLVLDDAWRRADVDVFDILGPRCRVLITTRDAGLLPGQHAVHHLLELFTDAEARRLLAITSGVEQDALPQDALEVLEGCGRLPMAVALAGGMKSAGTSWHDLRDAMRDHELEFLENAHEENEHHANLLRMIEVSVRALADDVQKRLVELAVLPEDEPVAAAAVTTLWQHTGNLSPRQSRKLLVELKLKSIVQLSRAADASAEDASHVFLHDLMHHYCVRRARHELGTETALHAAMLDAYRTLAPRGWWTGPNDGYFLDHLTWHLEAAGQPDAVHALFVEENEDKRNAWFSVRDYHGQLAGYVKDVERAWRLASDRNDLALECRYALITTTIHSLAGRVTLATLPQFAARRVWSARQALAYATNISEPKSRARALASLGPYLTPPSLLDQALEHALRIDDAKSRMWAVLGLAPYYSDPSSVWPKAMMAAESISDITDRCQAMLGLSLFVPASLKPAAIKKAIDCAERESDLAQRQLYQAIVQSLQEGTEAPLKKTKEELQIQLRNRADALKDLLPSLAELQDLDGIAKVLAALRRHCWLSCIIRWLPHRARPAAWPLVRTTVRRICGDSYREQVLSYGRFLAVLQPPEDLTDFVGSFVFSYTASRRTTPTIVLMDGAAALLLNITIALGGRYSRTTKTELRPWLEDILHRRRRPRGLLDHARLIDSIELRIDNGLYIITMRVEVEDVATAFVWSLARAGCLAEASEMLRILGLGNMIWGLNRLAMRDGRWRGATPCRDFMTLLRHGEVHLVGLVLLAARTRLARLTRAAITGVLLHIPVVRRFGWIQEKVSRLINGTESENERVRAITASVPYMDQVSLQSVVDGAHGIKALPLRALALAAVAPRLSGDGQQRLVEEVLDLLPNKVNDLDAANILVEFAGLVSGKVRNRALEVAWLMEDPWSQARAFAALGFGVEPHEPIPSEGASQGPIGEVGDHEMRALTRIVLAPYCPGQQPHDCSDQLAQISPKSPNLPGARVAVALKHARSGRAAEAICAARVISDVTTRLEAIRQLFPNLPERERTLALEVVLASAGECKSKEAVRELSRFVPLASGELQDRLVHRVVLQAVDWYDEKDKSALIAELARATVGPLPEQRLRDLVLWPKPINGEKVREPVLEALIAALPRLGGISLAVEAAKEITNLGRRARTLAYILEGSGDQSHGPAREVARVALESTIQEIRAIQDPWKRSEDLIEVCKVQPIWSGEALGLIRQLPGRSDRLTRLGQLIFRLGGAAAASVAQEILSEAIDASRQRLGDVADAIVPALAYWPAETRENAFAVVASAADANTNSLRRCEMLTRLWLATGKPRDSQSREKAYDTARGIMHPESKAAALLQLDMPEEALATAKSVEDPRKRATGLLGLVAKFPLQWKDRMCAAIVECCEGVASPLDEDTKRQACEALLGIGDIRAAAKVACGLQHRDQRHKKLREIAIGLEKVSAAEARAVLSLCLHRLSRSSREEFLGDLSMLVPAFETADSTLALAVADTMAQIGRWWP
jgi:hypothetical protein